MKRVACCFLLLIFLCGCNSTSYYESSIYAMDTYMTLRVYGSDAQTQTQQVISTINRLDQLLSAADGQSCVAMLNQTGSGEFPDEVADLLTRSISLSQQTGGALDPSVYAVVQLWGFPSQEYRVPSDAEIDAVLDTVGTAHIHLHGNSVTLDAGTQLDFGAVAKGYAGQFCASQLEENGATAALLSLGGNVQTLGSKPDGEPWVVGITDPENPDSYFATLSLTGTHAIVTSGAYHRYFEQNGKRYHHIIDPATGHPAESDLASVTIVADDGFLADGLSTALFVMGLEQAAGFYREREDFEAVFVTADGAVYVTEGLTGAFSGAACEVISR